MNNFYCMNKDIFISIFRGDVNEYFELIKGIDINSLKNGYSLLHSALASNKYKEEIVLDLITRGVDLNKPDEDGATPLEYCCEYQNFYIAKILLEKGVDVNPIDKWGNNPLWRAVFKEDYKMVKLLMHYGANPNNINKAKRSPLILAEENEDEEMIAIMTQKQ